jgi:hypothetical protein
VKVCAKKNTIKDKPPTYVVLLLVQDKHELQVSVNTFTKPGISDADPDAQSACFNFVKGLAQKLKDGAGIDQLKALKDAHIKNWKSSAAPKAKSAPKGKAAARKRQAEPASSEPQPKAAKVGSTGSEDVGSAAAPEDGGPTPPPAPQPSASWLRRAAAPLPPILGPEDFLTEPIRDFLYTSVSRPQERPG